MIMTLFFQAIFTWAAPLMDGVESIVIAMGSLIASVLPDGVLADFVNDAIFGGLGAFLVFAPLVFILTMIVGALEDSGYLARAALICHRPLSFFGLSGKSFVPLLSGVACAIPAIYAARTMSSRQERLLTYVAIPLMPCSARLPVYALLIAILIPD
jgi:ferrous iron transport protein B